MLQRPVAYVAGVGSAAPSGTLTNADLEKTLETTDAWITDRTGIRNRFIAEPAESMISYTLKAAHQAMERAGVTPMDLDGIVFATVTPDRRLPSVGCDLQAALGAERAWAFDLVAACPGWVYGLAVAEGMMVTGLGDTILVIGAEKLSTITDREDRNTAILFGDGAGAGVLRRCAPDDDRGILATYLGADGKLADLLYIPGGGAADPMTEEVLRDKRHLMKMAGREVFKAAVLAMSRSSDEAIRRAGMPPESIDLLVPHQANLRITDSVVKALALPDSVVIARDVVDSGNTSAASVPLALTRLYEQGEISKGDLVLLLGFGAGLTAAGQVVRCP